MSYDYFNITAYSLMLVIAITGLVLKKLKKANMLVIAGLVVLPLVAIDIRNYIINKNNSIVDLFVSILMLGLVAVSFILYFIARNKIRKANPIEAVELVKIINKLEGNEEKSIKRNPLTARIIVLMFLLPVDILLIRGLLGYIPGKEVFMVFVLISLFFFAATTIISLQAFSLVNKKEDAK